MEKCVLLWLKTMLQFRYHIYEKIFINIWYKFFIFDMVKGWQLHALSP